MIWALDGGHFGYHTPGSPRHWGEDVPGNVPKLVGTGNGSPAGILVYEGNLLPREYFGSVLEVDAGTRQVNFFPITRTGASFRTQYQVFLASDDPWFRPVDAVVAPDGSVCVADWYDAGVGGHAFSDQTTGRIFRVAPRGQHTARVTADFGSLDGLIAALKSPTVATRDAARRGLIARGAEAAGPLHRLFTTAEPIFRARALFVLAAIEGDQAVIPALRDADPRIREQAVRMLGRDCRENGHVDYRKPEARRPAPALAHLAELLPLANDPDAGVRRELILALRSLPTGEAGEALRKLAAAWDGQDRWYLEALGLALEHRESRYLAGLLDGSLFGALDLDRSGRDGKVALPPYFPVDRNEAFIPAGSPEPAATPLSRNLGLAWRIHTADVLPLLTRVVHHLSAPELQQAADDILRQIRSPESARLLAEMVDRARDPGRKRELLTTLGRNLQRQPREVRREQPVDRVVRSALMDPQTRAQAIAIVAAGRDDAHDEHLKAIVMDEKVPVEERVAATEAMGAGHGPARRFLEQLITATEGKPNSTPVANAALRTIASTQDTRTRLTELITARNYPLGLRREAVRALFENQDGGSRIIALAHDGKLPEDLKTEAVTLLLAHRDRAIRDQAARVLPMPKIADGRVLPPIGQLLHRRGDAAKGKDVFFRIGQTACAACHRVQGQGQWIGPDLSTIGTKYGKDELLKSILNPSAAIGYNFRSIVVGLADGRTITGLAVEESAERLVLKNAEGQRIVIKTADIEDRKTSEVSLMPEGLAQTMTDQQLVDLLAYLSTLREPVSIVGQYHIAGPVQEPDGAPLIDPHTEIKLDAPLSAPGKQTLSWRRLDASAEGLADLGVLAGSTPPTAVYAYAPLRSPIEQAQDW